MLVLSTPLFTGAAAASTGLASASNFVCLSYIERDGILEATANSNSCQLPGVSSYQSYYQPGFNITEGGPCLQALTGHAPSTHRGATQIMALMTLALLIVIHA